MNNLKFLKGKSILITSYSYSMFGGAELNSVELADQLKIFGAKVDFFSYDIDGPLAAYINQEFNTRVMSDSVNILAKNESPAELKNTQIDIAKYDYIWVGANTIPISILKQISGARKIPKFIFIHMSSLIGFPLDAPLLYEFEKTVATRILSLGKETTEHCIYRVLSKDVPISEWNNPAPRDYRMLAKRSGQLKKIAVISSSHPSTEIIKIKDHIEKNGITIDYIGPFNNNPQIVDAKFYDKYDLIIGIGKNAKYSLVSGVPIYVYGRFGGGGYLNTDSVKINNSYNFSGRGFGKKTATQIATDIIDGYQTARMFHETNRDKFIQEFSLDVVAEKLFREVENEKPKQVSFPEEYINWLVSMQINIMQRLQASAGGRDLTSRVASLEKQLSASKRELEAVYASKSWTVTYRLRKAAELARKMRGNR